MALPTAVERWRPLATQAAAQAGAAEGVTVPVNLVLSIVMVESSGNPLAQARENDGEWSRGLMQVKEATARALGIADSTKLLQPAVGLAVGSRLLAKQLKRYNGAVGPAVAAYNAGTAHYTQAETFTNQPYVDKVLGWLKRAGGAIASPAGVAGIVGAVAVIAMILVAWKSSRGGARSSAGGVTPRTITARW